MNLSDLLTTLWQALRGNIGGGQDFVVVYTSLGAILWAFLLFKVFLQEGLQVVTGHGSELPRILVKYLFVAGAFAVWPAGLKQHLFCNKGARCHFLPQLEWIARHDGRIDAFHGRESTGCQQFTRSRQHRSGNSLQLHSRQSLCSDRDGSAFSVLCLDPDKHSRFIDHPRDESRPRSGFLCSFL